MEAVGYVKIRPDSTHTLRTTWTGESGNEGRSPRCFPSGSELDVLVVTTTRRRQFRDRSVAGAGRCHESRLSDLRPFFEEF